MGQGDEDQAKEPTNQQHEATAEETRSGLAEIAADVADGVCGSDLALEPQSRSLYRHSRHFSGLVRHCAELKQELAKHDAALVPVVEAIGRLDQAIRIKTQELGQAQSRLSAAERDAAAARREAAEKNPAIRASIDFLENKARSFKARIEKRSENSNTLLGLIDLVLAGTIDSALQAERWDDNDDAILERWSKRADEYRRQLVDTSTPERHARAWEADVRAVENAIERYREERIQQAAQRTEAENKKTYEVFAQFVLDQQAVELSEYLADYAEGNGTTLDHVLESAGIGELAKQFAGGRLTRDALDAALVWAKAERGNFDLDGEELAFKQFVNRTVVPNLGSCEALASMVDDLKKTGVEGRQPLELLRQKEITFSGRKTPQSLDSTQAKAAAAEVNRMAEPIRADAAKIDQIIRSDHPVAVNVRSAIAVNEGHLTQFEALFAGIDQQINQLLGDKAKLDLDKATRTKALESGIGRNERLDEQIGVAEFHLEKRNAHLPKEKPMALRILEQGLRYSAEGAAVGGGAGATLLGLGEIPGVILGGLGGLGYGAYKGWQHVDPQKAEAAIRKELVQYLHSQRVDLEKHAAEIQAIAARIDGLLADKRFQEQVGSKLKVERIQNAYVARSLLRSAVQNSSLLGESCELNGGKSLDRVHRCF